MLLLQTVTHVHCRAIRSVSTVALRIEHANGKYVTVNEDGSVEATGCVKDTSTSFYLRLSTPFVFTLESVQNESQYLLVNEAGNLTVAPLPELELGSGSSEPVSAPTYEWRFQVDAQGVLALTTSINDTDCFIAFDADGQALPPCDHDGIFASTPEVRRIEFE